MAEDIIQKYTADLVKDLPMNDPIFMLGLDDAGLLPGNLKVEVQSQLTIGLKAGHFLWYGIKNDTESFNKLLEVMEGHVSDDVKKLAEKICREIKSNKLNVHFLYFEFLAT